MNCDVGYSEGEELLPRVTEDPAGRLVDSDVLHRLVGDEIRLGPSSSASYMRNAAPAAARGS